MNKKIALLLISILVISVSALALEVRNPEPLAKAYSKTEQAREQFLSRAREFKEQLSSKSFDELRKHKAEVSRTKAPNLGVTITPAEAKKEVAEKQKKILEEGKAKSVGNMGRVATLTRAEAARSKAKREAISSGTRARAAAGGGVPVV